MSRRRRQGLSPSLFPFLAVLVCTLGTLILLLALVADNATTAAEQKARAEQQALASKAAVETGPPRMSREAVETLLREEEFRVTELVAVRDQQTTELASRRDEMTHVEDHIERLRQQIRRLNEEVRQATGEMESPPISDYDLAAIKEQIETEQETIRKLREDASDHSPRVVIVPHKGPNGTDRRPVYLECRADGLTIWPEGSEISIDQLENSSNSANPLDAALRTIRMHAMQTYGDSVPPYPLIVVRPDGIDTYGAARRAMKDWDDQFGYELVPAEVKLAFAQPDANLKRRVEVAINHAVAEQRVRLAMVNRSLQGRAPVGGRLRDGSVGGNAPTPRTSLPTLSAAALDRAGRANGFSPLRDDHRDHRAQSPSASASGGSYSRGSYAQGPQIGSITNNGYAGNAAEMTDSGAAARRMAEQMQAAANQMRAEGQSLGSLGGGENELDPSTQRSSPMGRHFADLQAPGTESEVNDANRSGLPQDEMTASDAASSGFGSSSGQPLSGQALAEQSLALSQNRDGSPGDDSATESAEGSQGDMQTSDADVTADTASNPSSSQSGASSGSSAPNSAQPSQTAQQSRDMQQFQNMQGAPQMQGSPTVTGSPVMMDQELADDPRLSKPPMELNRQPPRGASAEMVRRQGRDWALPASVAGMHGNAIIRTIRVACYPDRFVLLSAKNDGATEIFGFFDGEIERATLELATALRSRIDQWGPALPGGRWQPRLEVQITPHSDMRFHQLRTLMNGSGIEVIGSESP